jgi:hypothetical protein
VSEGAVAPTRDDVLNPWKANLLIAKAAFCDAQLALDKARRDLETAEAAAKALESVIKE